MPARLCLAGLLGGLLVQAPQLLSAAEVADLISQGDAAWSSRAEGSDGGTAAAGPIARAITAYEAAVAADPPNLEARWKLLRALFFHGDYVLETENEKEALFASGKTMADETRDRLHAAAGLTVDPRDLTPSELAASLRGFPDAAAVYFWSAAHWGLWGKYHGKLAAARQGVATRIRDFAQVVVELDGSYEAAGGHRILGRLHTEAPKVPFFTGWIDRDVAVRETLTAARLFPDEPLNVLYAAEALLEFEPNRRAEALEMLRELVRKEPRPHFAVEDARILADSRSLLSKWDD